MKIGIDIRLIGKKRTGDEAVFLNLVKNLVEIDKNNKYFLFTDRDPDKNSELAEEIKKLELADNFKIIFINSPNRFWWNLWALPNYLRQNPVDIFHTQYIAPFWLPKNIKLVLTIHDISFNFFPQFIKFSDLFFLKTLIPRSLKMATKIISVSEFTKKEIEKYYHIPTEKISVIHNGVDFELFNQTIDQEKLREIKSKYNLPAAPELQRGEPEKFILYIGTLQPRKNIPVLIKVMKILQEKYGLQDTKLIIAGNRKAHNFDLKIDEVIEKYNLQKSVIFPGWIDEEDKPALYKLAQCFAFPSLYEGFGIPIIEAMAAGTPVVCSNQPALLEIGESATLTSETDNTEKFAENIFNILSSGSVRNDLIDKGKERAKFFSWPRNAENTLSLYTDLEK